MALSDRGCVAALDRSPATLFEPLLSPGRNRRVRAAPYNR